jgi:acetyl-CoA acetyltransferase
MAGIEPRQVQVAECHDYTSFCEIEQAEALGFCDCGKGGAFFESGAASHGGRIPINTSGGLVSKSHPASATGVSMVCELVMQLRQESGPRQVPGATIGLQQNSGGLLGIDDAVSSVMILHAVS